MMEGEQNTPFCISPEPFYIDRGTLSNQIEALGPRLVSPFTRRPTVSICKASGGVNPIGCATTSNVGKSETVLDYQKMRRFRSNLPVIIRPDVIPTDDGLIVSELDSVPGGFGLLAGLWGQYAKLGFELVGGADGSSMAFGRLSSSLAREASRIPLVAIVVSDESESYRGERSG